MTYLLSPRDRGWLLPEVRVGEAIGDLPRSINDEGEEVISDTTELTSAFAR